MADQSHGGGTPAPVVVDRAPRVLALRVEAGLECWVIALPTDEALVIDPAGRVVAHTTVDRIRRRSRRGGPDLVEVVEYSDRPLAA
jgi:hypothetical protein